MNKPDSQTDSYRVPVEHMSGQKVSFSEEAGVYLAAHIKEGEAYNSFDDGKNKSEISFLHDRFDATELRDKYGLSGTNSSNQNDSFFEAGSDQACYSDHDHFTKDVKRFNLIELFLQGNDFDKYITTHLYGADSDSIMVGNLMTERDNKNALLQKLKSGKEPKIKKMTAFQAYIAIVKGYCGAAVLFAPKAWANGGSIWSPIAIIFGGWFTGICAIKLIKCGQKLKCYNYSDIVQTAFGTNYKILLDVIIGITQFFFTVPSICFITTSLKDLMTRQNLSTTLVDLNNLWTYGVPIVLILSILAWVRNIAKFTFTFLFANTLLIMSVIIICAYSIIKLRDDGIHPSVEAINTTGMWTTLGYAIYTLEGIGVLMPIMQACDCPEKFDKILTAGVSTLTVMFLIFGTLSYLAFGNMKEQMATQLLPQGDAVVQVVILLYIIIMTFTYPLTIFPANQICESYIFTNKKNSGSNLQYWGRNFTRFLVCFAAAYSGIELQDLLDKFIGIVGSIALAPVALIFPTFCHMKLVAETRTEKLIDILIIAISFLIMALCIGNTIANL